VSDPEVACKTAAGKGCVLAEIAGIS